MAMLETRIDGSNGLELFSGQQAFVPGETALACFRRFFHGKTVNDKLEPLFSVLLGADVVRLEPGSFIPVGAKRFQVILTDLVSAREYDEMIIRQWRI